jgi:hypothetical protein
VAKGEQGPVTVVPDGPLPTGVKIVYWGCDEGAASATCTVTADAERSVCVTTTSPKDTAARSRCAALGGTDKEASVPPWARILGVWTRQDGAKFDFDGANARWLPASREDLTVCRYTVDDPSSSTTITMTCQDLDSSREATISLSAAGDIGNRDRTLTITGDATLSGTYLSAAAPTDPGTVGPDGPGGASAAKPPPRFNPCSVVTQAEVAALRGYLSGVDDRRTQGPDPAQGPVYGTCTFQSPDSRTSADVEHFWVEGIEGRERPLPECEASGVAPRSWFCDGGSDGPRAKLFTYLDNNSYIRVTVRKWPLGSDPIPDPAAAAELTRMILARI